MRFFFPAPLTSKLRDLKTEIKMMEPKIRGANSGDIPEIQRLFRQLDSHHAEVLPEIFQPVDGEARENDVIQTMIDREDGGYLLATCDGKVVGFVSIEISTYPEFPMFRPHEYALIDSAVVDKAYRGKGIGGMLCRAAIQWCKRRGLRQIQTNVWHENVEAREFYLDFGFLPMTVKLELNIEEDAEQADSFGAEKSRG